MVKTGLETFTDGVRKFWGPLSSEVVHDSRRQMEALLQAPPSEAWLSQLHREAPPSAELYRDPKHGFVLLAHTEYAGLYRAPHDHGRSWVIYGVQQGEVEMGSYGRIVDDAGKVRLVKRDAVIVRPGQALVYLPGDIHDTRCLTETALLFRFTERDLKLEDQRDHQITRYVQENGAWTAGPR